MVFVFDSVLCGHVNAVTIFKLGRGQIEQRLLTACASVHKYTAHTDDEAHQQQDVATGGCHECPSQFGTHQHQRVRVPS